MKFKLFYCRINNTSYSEYGDNLEYVVRTWGEASYAFVIDDEEAARMSHASTEPTEPDPAEPTTPTFTDVPAGSWYEKAVNWAAEQHYVNGVDDTRFAPTSDCTHEQILTMLYRVAQSVDEASNDDMAKAVEWAEANGMIGDTFNAKAPCTRADAVKYIWEVFGKQSGADISFEDVDADADYAAAVAWAVSVGIADAGGTGNNQFTPDMVCNRGHIVTFLYRAYVEPLSE